MKTIELKEVWVVTNYTDARFKVQKIEGFFAKSNITKDEDLFYFNEKGELCSFSIGNWCATKYFYKEEDVKSYIKNSLESSIKYLKTNALKYWKKRIMTDLKTTETSLTNLQTNGISCISVKEETITF